MAGFLDSIGNAAKFLGGGIHQGSGFLLDAPSRILGEVPLIGGALSGVLRPVTGGLTYGIGQLTGQEPLGGIPFLTPLLSGLGQGIGNIPVIGGLLGAPFSIGAQATNGFGNWIAGLFGGGDNSHPPLGEVGGIPVDPYHRRGSAPQQGGYDELLGNLSSPPPTPNVPGRGGSLHIN